jgi:hypothetical protein
LGPKIWSSVGRHSVLQESWSGAGKPQHWCGPWDRRAVQPFAGGPVDRIIGRPEVKVTSIEDNDMEKKRRP